MSEQVPLEDSTVLVTGASGFIGSHLVDTLLERGCKVHCLVRQSSNLRWLDTSRVHLFTVDLSQPSIVPPFLGEAEYIFHCAGLTKAKTKDEYFKANATTCTLFYEQCAAHGDRIKNIVHLSSLAAVGPGLPDYPVNESTICNPLTYYGQSKRAGEEIAEQDFSSLPIVIIRPPVVYGPREENFFTYLQAISRGWNIRVGLKHRELSLIYVKDLVRAMIDAAARPPEEDKIFFVTDGNVYPWKDVARTAIQTLKVPARTLVIPETVFSIFALFSEALSVFRSTAPLFDRQRFIDIRQSAWTASAQKFFHQYNFEPQYDLEKGLKETIHWYKQHRWL